MNFPAKGWTIVAVSALAAFTVPAYGQSSADLPFTRATMVIAASAGGGSDTQGRVVAAAAQALRPGLVMSVENRPGGSTAIGYTHLFQQKGKPDFLLAAGPSLLSVPLTVDTPYTWQDFTPIAQIASDSLTLVVSSGSAYETLPQLVEAARDSSIVAGVVAATGPDSIALELLSTDQDVEFRRVVFEAGGETVAALLAGDIDFLIANPGEVEGQVRAGTMHPIAMFSSERNASYPDIPTATEQGIDVVHGQWRGIIAAGDISEEAEAFWVGVLEDWFETDDYRQYIAVNQLDAEYSTGDEFADYLAEQEQVLKTVMGL